MRNGVLSRKESSDLRFYVPCCMQTNVIRTCHDDVGHVGVDKTQDLIKRTYWFPKMRQLIRDHIANSLKCIIYSPIENRHREFLQNIDKGSHPFHTLYIRFISIIMGQETSRKFKYIILIIDAFSNFLKICSTKTTNAKEVITFLQSYTKLRYTNSFNI